jgi:hypothetical protein
MIQDLKKHTTAKGEVLLQAHSSDALLDRWTVFWVILYQNEPQADGTSKQERHVLSGTGTLEQAEKLYQQAINRYLSPLTSSCRASR